MYVLSAPEHEAMIRWTRNDAVINARLCRIQAGWQDSSPGRLSSRRVLKGCMQIEWFSEPKRADLNRGSLQGRKGQSGGRRLWLDHPKPRTTCTNSDKV